MPSPTAASRVMPIDWSTRPISSMATHRLVKSPSAPPYCSGAVSPNRPSEPIFCTTSTGKWWSRSHWAAWGAISFSAKSRTVRRNCSWSSDKSKLMRGILTRMLTIANPRRVSRFAPVETVPRVGR